MRAFCFVERALAPLCIQASSFLRMVCLFLSPAACISSRSAFMAR